MYLKNKSRPRQTENFWEATSLIIVDKLQKEVVQEFTVWVGGSFVTQKQDPQDLDAVFFLDYRVCENKKTVLDNVWFNGELKFTKGLDVYYSIEYPASHNRHFLSHLNHLYWEDLYGHTRQDAAGRRFPKGFVELKFK
jgi:uncharacterized protein DUF6932